MCSRRSGFYATTRVVCADVHVHVACSLMRQMDLARSEQHQVIQAIRQKILEAQQAGVAAPSLMGTSLFASEGRELDT